MLFWITCLFLTLAVGAMIAIPMLRPPPAREEDPQVLLYKAQLEEVDRDVARDIISAEDGERAKTEIARRLIAATEQDGPMSAGVTSPILAGGVVVAVIAVAGWTYWEIGAPGYPDLPLQTRIENGNEARENRPTQAQAAAAAPVLPTPEVPEDQMVLITQLRTIVPNRPDDLQGWTLLAFHEAKLGNFTAAAEAQANVNRLQPSVEGLMKQANLMVGAANGFISPEVEVLVRQALDTDPNNIAGRYYLGALYNQTDRPDLALRLWRSILDSGAPEDFHMTLARAQVSDAALRAGTDYTPPPAISRSVADVANDPNLTDEDRTEMVQGMVAGLASRLSTQGGTVNEWARLITAYGVLGQIDDAKAILAEARGVFGASDDALAVLGQAAETAGLSQ